MVLKEEAPDAVALLTTGANIRSGLIADEAGELVPLLGRDSGFNAPNSPQQDRTQ
jgi:hypothetical protein